MLVAKAKVTKMAKRAGICFTNCSKIGVSCTRLLATGPMGLFYKLNRGGEGGCSTAVEVREWAQEYEARNTERID